MVDIDNIEVFPYKTKDMDGDLWITLIDAKKMIERREREVREEGFKQGFNDCKGLVEKGEHAQCCIVPPSSSQVDKLAKFIMEHIPGEPSQSEGE